MRKLTHVVQLAIFTVLLTQAHVSNGAEWTLVSGGDLSAWFNSIWESEILGVTVNGIPGPDDTAIIDGKWVDVAFDQTIGRFRLGAPTTISTGGGRSLNVTGSTPSTMEVPAGAENADFRLGTVDFSANVSDVLLSNSGTIRSGTITATHGMLDLDGPSHTGKIIAERITFDARIDDFAGDMTILNHTEFTRGLVLGESNAGATVDFMPASTQPATLFVGNLTVNHPATSLTVYDQNGVGEGSIDADSFSFNAGNLTLNENSSLRVDADTFFASDSITNLLASSELKIASTFNFSPTATLTGAGTMTIEPTGFVIPPSAGATIGTQVENNGVLALNSFDTGATLTTNGFRQGSTGELRLKLGGAIPNQYDSLSVAANDVSLDGTLNVSLVEGYQPNLGDSFFVLNSTNPITGEFSTVEFPPFASDSGKQWRVVYEQDAVFLTVDSAPIVIEPDFDKNGVLECEDVDSLVEMIVAGNNPAEFDMTQDGLVDNQDLDAWLLAAGIQRGDATLNGAVSSQDYFVWDNNKFTQNSEFCSGDFNADGLIDVADFNIWNEARNAGQPASVPEPRFSLWLVLAVLMFRRFQWS